MWFCVRKTARWGLDGIGPQTPGRMRSAKEIFHGTTKSIQFA